MDKKLLQAFVAHQQRAAIANLTPDYDAGVHQASRKQHSNATVVIIGAGISGMLCGEDGFEITETLTVVRDVYGH